MGPIDNGRKIEMEFLEKEKKFDPEEVYGLYRKDKSLYYKNKRVFQSMYKINRDGYNTKTTENAQQFLEACTTNYIFEGVFFYSAFLIFYNFAKNNKMRTQKETTATETTTAKRPRPLKAWTN